MSVQNILKKLNRRDTQLIPRFPKFLKLTILLIVSISALLFVRSSFAQQILTDEAANSSMLKQKQDAIKKNNNQESWMYESMGSNATAGIMAGSGEIPDSVLKGDSTGWIPGGIIGGTNKVIASLYNQPVSGVEYIAQIKDSFLGKPAYAQGVGFAGLQPLLPLWRIFRNVVYVVSSLVFVVVGIMIMLRIKISPQAVITIQSAIPKIITTLILVTFSYAIAGLLIDLTYVIQAIFLSLLFQGSGANPTQDLFLQNQSVVSKIKEFLLKLFLNRDVLSTFGSSNLTNLTNMDVFRLSNLVRDFVPTAATFVLGALAGGIVGSFVGIGVAGAALGGVILVFVLQLMVIIYLIKFLIALIKCYFNVILKIILGPLEIGLGSIPNMKMGFSTWITDLIANLSVFPICSIFIVLITLIMKSLDSQSAFLWAPSVISLAGFTGLTKMIIGLGAILLLPKLPTMIPEFVFQIKPSPWGKAIGEGFKTIPGSGIVNTFKKGVQEQSMKRMGEGSEFVVKTVASEPINKVKTKIKEWKDSKSSEETRGGAGKPT